MTYKENYHRMLQRNKATGYAIYHCLLKVYRQHSNARDLSGITSDDITRISQKLSVSERWIRHVLNKYHLFFTILDQYFPEKEWEDEGMDD